jgi:hypothetical protein
MLKIEELEKLLLKNWSCFLDARKLLEFAKLTAEQELKMRSPKITTLSITHCELCTTGLIFWIDYKIVDNNRFVNATTEFFLDLKGNVNHIKTI